MYIRTKDGVYENVNPYFIKENKLYMSWDYPTGIEADFLGDILNQSENLEELCDEFVYENQEYETPQRCYQNCHGIWFDDQRLTHLTEKEISTIKGAIWTEWGLKYVAKMNESGDLELI